MTAAHTWKFFRAGGFEQVKLETGVDLLALSELDQKLWAALSCPTHMLEFDARTLELIDGDGDGQIRPNEVLAAIAWAAGLLKNADLLLKGADRLALTDIDESSEEGKQVYASAWYILKSLGRSAASVISLADIADIEQFIAAQKPNGDGVICAQDVTDPGLRAVVEDIIQYGGAVPDRSGASGITQEISDGFFAEAAAYAAWYDRGDGNATILPFQEQTEAAVAALYAVRDKVDDYFLRCELAAYDAAAAELLSGGAIYQQLATQNLAAQHEEIANLPLAPVAAGQPLPLTVGLNPVWRERMAAVHQLVVTPSMGEREQITGTEWRELCGRFAAYDGWQAEKPLTRVEGLGIARIREILGGGYQAAAAELLAEDRAMAARLVVIHTVERLLRYNRDLFRLINNFVSFLDLYSGSAKAIFQAGTLYLDGRSCELCVRVDDIARHAEVAGGSGLCLVYCECERQGGADRINIAAAMTAGDSDFLAVGGNGVFYDRQGQDWNARIVRIIEHPISIRQVFWRPYLKLARFVGEQFQRLIALKDWMNRTPAAPAANAGEKPVPADTAPKTQFEAGRFLAVLVLAALFIAVIGGIGAIVSGLLELTIWQLPVALIELMLLISGPYLVLVWFKLRRRDLGPVLAASGWTINARLHITTPLGAVLTRLADVPRDAQRSLADPFAEQQPLWPYLLTIALGICAMIGLWYVGFF